MKKRILLTLSVLLCLLCLFALTACDEEGDTPDVEQAEQGGETPHVHSYGEWSVTTPATCGASGVETRACACGASETRPIAAKGGCIHDTNNVCTVCNTTLQYTEGLEYTLNTDEVSYTVIGIGTATDSDIVIPPYHNQMPVTGIGEMAFSLNTITVLSITIPASVTTIADNPTAYCGDLERIKVESGNTVYHSAGNCLIETASKTLVSGCNNSIIPTDESVIKIGNYSFAGCEKLWEITIPDGVTSIDLGAFSGCFNLTTITIPESMTNIGSSFDGCYKLIEIYNLSSITITAGQQGPGMSMMIGYIGDYAKNVYTDAAAPSKQFTDSNGYRFYDDGTNRYLLGYVGDNTVLTLPASCKGHDYEIYQYAFMSCVDVTSITVPSSVIGIGDGAFYYCEGLSAIAIPASVTSIGTMPFAGCNNLESITVASDNTVYSGVGDCLIEIASKTLIAGCKNSVIPTDGSVTFIGENAFYECKGLTEIHIPASVTVIDTAAFLFCDKLTTVTFEENSQLTKIGALSFYYCESLSSIVIPIDVSLIENDVFWGCIALTAATFENTEGWTGYDMWTGQNAPISATDLANPSTAATLLKSGRHLIRT